MGAGAKKKGYIKNLKTGVVKTLMYNPEDISDDQSISYKTVGSPCSSYPVAIYTGTGERTISIDIFLYGKPQYVEEWVNWINSGVNPTYKWDVPPVYTYALGNYVHNVVITKIKRKFNLWDKNLGMKQVTLSLTLLEV